MDEGWKKSNRQEGNEDEVLNSFRSFPSFLKDLDTYNYNIQRQYSIEKGVKEGKDSGVLEAGFDDFTIKEDVLFHTSDLPQYKSWRLADIESKYIKVLGQENILGNLGMGFYSEKLPIKEEKPVLHIRVEDSVKFFNSIFSLKEKNLNNEDIQTFYFIWEFIFKWAHDVCDEKSSESEKNEQLFFGDFFPDLMKNMDNLNNFIHDLIKKFPNKDLALRYRIFILQNMCDFHQQGSIKEFSLSFLGDSLKEEYLLEANLLKENIDKNAPLVIEWAKKEGIANYINKRTGFLFYLLEQVKTNPKMGPIFLFFHDFLKKLLESGMFIFMVQGKERSVAAKKMKEVLEKAKQDFDNIKK